MNSDFSGARCQSGQRGSALVYILIAIALLAALTVSFMDNSGSQVTSQNVHQNVSEIQSQAEFIRSNIQECVLVYSKGDAGALASASPVPAEPQVNHPYPLRPTNDYFDNCDLGGFADGGAADNDQVQYLRCPGRPGDDPCHGRMFGGMTGKFLPPVPALFEPWEYYAGEDGIFIWLHTTRTDAFLDAVFDRFEEGYSTCEVDIIRADASSVAMNSDDDDFTVSCPVNARCMRVWMRQRASAVFPAQSSKEGDCP